jgi:hypothetical protein
LAFIGADAFVGLPLAVFFFATPATALVIALGAIAGMLPDPLQFVHTIYPREPLKSLQRFHSWIHSKRRLRWRLGVSSQLVICRRDISVSPINELGRDASLNFNPPRTHSRVLASGQIKQWLTALAADERPGLD